ncbi:MAG: hypothetical protein O7E52_15900 [Candidatus Poribacteria bacterium]|nr:hypothetical protein [Candidatus Poribacteria bacterium]
MNAHEFFAKKNPDDYNFDEALNLIKDYGQFLQDELKEPSFQEDFSNEEGNPFIPEGARAGQPLAEEMYRDVVRIFNDRSFFRKMGHTLGVRGKELFSFSDASSETVGGVVGVTIGLAFEAMGISGSAEVLGGIGGAIAASVTEASGRGGSTVESAVSDTRASHRAERTLNFRQVMQGLDAVISGRGKNLSNSTWHYRVAYHIEEELREAYWNPNSSESATYPDWHPFHGKGTKKKDKDKLEHFAYKVCSYMHHVEKVQRNLWHILQLLAYVGGRAQMWKFLWEGGYPSPFLATLHSLAYFLSPVCARPDHSTCEAHELCYQEVEVDATTNSNRRQTSSFVSFQDSVGRPSHPLTAWMDLSLAKEDVRGTRTTPSKKKQAASLFKRKKKQDELPLTAHAQEDKVEQQYYDSYFEATGEDDESQDIEEDLDTEDSVESKDSTEPESLYQRFVLFPKYMLVNRFGHGSEKRKPEVNDRNWMFNGAGNGHDDLCKTCETDLAWLLHRVYDDIENKPFFERLKRKTGRKWKNADKGKLTITVAVAATGVVVSVLTAGLAIPVAIGATAAVAVGGQAAQATRATVQIESHMKNNRERMESKEASQSDEPLSGRDAKKELKIDQKMMKTFASKVRRHFKACEEAWSRMMYFATGGGTIQERDDPRQFRFENCFQAVQYAWAAKKFQHHYEKLALYMLPTYYYAQQMIHVLSEWERSWDEKYPHYMDLIRRHFHCPHSTERFAPRSSTQTFAASSAVDFLADCLEEIDADFPYIQLVDDDEDEDSWSPEPDDEQMKKPLLGAL